MTRWFSGTLLRDGAASTYLPGDLKPMSSFTHRLLNVIKPMIRPFYLGTWLRIPSEVMLQLRFSSD